MSEVLTADTLRELLNYDPETGVLKWRVSKSRKCKAGSIAGAVTSYGYIQLGLNYKKYQAHCLVWLHVHGEFPPQHVDHINGQKSDNRIANLRLANKAENGRNRGAQANNSSGLKGVTKNHNRWISRIVTNGKTVRLGNFDTPEAAHEAYCRAAVIHHGEFARTE